LQKNHKSIEMLLYKYTLSLYTSY